MDERQYQIYHPATTSAYRYEERVLDENQPPAEWMTDCKPMNAAQRQQYSTKLIGDIMEKVKPVPIKNKRSA